MSETVRCVEGVRIKGLPDGMKYQLMSNLEEAYGTGKGWVVSGTHNGKRAPAETATKGYVRVRKLNAKTSEEKDGVLYIVTLQDVGVFPPPCPSVGGRRKAKTYKKKRMSKKRMTRRR